MARKHYVAKCPKCGNVQAYHTGKDLTSATFRCRDNGCGRTTKIHDKRSGGLRVTIEGPMKNLEAATTTLVYKRRDHPSVEAALQKVQDKLENMPPHRREDMDPPTVADMVCPSEVSEFHDASEMAGSHPTS